MNSGPNSKKIDVNFVLFYGVWGGFIAMMIITLYYFGVSQIRAESLATVQPQRIPAPPPVQTVQTVITEKFVDKTTRLIIREDTAEEYTLSETYRIGFDVDDLKIHLFVPVEVETYKKINPEITWIRCQYHLDSRSTSGVKIEKFSLIDKPKAP